MSEYVSSKLRRMTRARADDRCEYCLLPGDCTIASHQPDHIIAIKHAGKTVVNNLAWACAFCNSQKGSDIASIDPESGRLTRLFNPRTDLWSDHFVVKHVMIVGKSPIGRATVSLLNFNDERALNQRRSLMKLGRFP